MQSTEELRLAARRSPQPATSNKSDEALIKSIVRGSRPALELLFVRHRLRIYRFVVRLTGNATLAEDVVSEVFLEVWRKADGFHAKSQVSTWLFAIARNKALHALRSRSMECLDDSRAGNIADTSEDPEAALNQKNRSAMLRKCLGQLPPAQREIVDLVYYHGKSVTEVARIIGIPAGTVKSRMFYARSQISGLLAQAGVIRIQEC